MNDNITNLEKSLGLPAGFIKQVHDSTEEAPFDFLPVVERRIDDIKTVALKDAGGDEEEIAKEIRKKMEETHKKNAVKLLGIRDKYTRDEISKMSLEDLYKDTSAKWQEKVDAASQSTDESLKAANTDWAQKYDALKAEYQDFQTKYDTDLAAEKQNTVDFQARLSKDNFLSNEISKINIAPSLGKGMVTAHIRRSAEDNLNIDTETGNITGKDGKPFSVGNDQVIRTFSEYVAHLDSIEPFTEQSFGGQQPKGEGGMGGSGTGDAQQGPSDAQKKMLEAHGLKA